VETIGLLVVEVVPIVVEVEVDQLQHLMLVLALVDFIMVRLQMAGGLLQARIVEVVEEHMVLEVSLHTEVVVVPVLSSSLILHKYTQGYIPINNKNIYSL
jgi:hypothetical protein